MGRWGLPLALLVAGGCAPARPAWQPVDPPAARSSAYGAAADRHVDLVGWQQLAPASSSASGSASSGSASPSAASTAAPPFGDPAPADAAAAAPSPPGQEATADGADDPDEEIVDDGLEVTHEAQPAQQPRRPPTIQLSDQEIAARLRTDPGSLGPMCVGTVNAGYLVNGVQMPRGEHWELVDPSNAWGTRETIDFLTRSIEKVHDQFPTAPALYIGHISAKRGGHLSPHVSHQAGRDVDISYFLTTPSRGFIKATADNLDRAKTWAFIKALIVETDVEMILIDTSIQKLLDEHASNVGEDEAWLDQIFQSRGKSRAALVRYAKGHQNHLHIRFYSPLAQEMGRRAYPMLAHTLVVHTDAFITYKARKGDTLGSIARRYGTTVEAIQKANNLRSNAIQAQHVYRIPKKGSVQQHTLPQPGPALLPPRRLPPTRTAVSVR